MGEVTEVHPRFLALPAATETCLKDSSPLGPPRQLEPTLPRDELGCLIPLLMYPIELPFAVSNLP